MENFTYSTIVPLIGGMNFGAQKITGKNPEYILSYPAFAGNDGIYTNYYPDIPYYVIDEENKLPGLGKLSGIHLPKVDFVTTLCPCAGLSQLNNGKSRGANAPQNDWMYKSAEFVLENIKPRAMIGENAPGLFGPIGAPVLTNLREIGKKHGYSLSIVKTSSIFHGIPQKRPRTFYFFWDTENVPILSHIKKETPSYEEFLSKFEEKDLEEKLEKTLELQNNPLYIWFKMHHPDWRKWMKTQFGSFMAVMIGSGKGEEYLKWCKEKYPNDHKFAERAYMKRLQGKGFWDSSPFLPSDFAGAFTGARMNAVHPVEDRVLTRRELMNLMGLPTDMVAPLGGDMGRVFQNVPSLTAADWIGEVIKFLKGDLEMSDVSFLKQDNFKGTIQKEKNASKLF